MSLAALFDRLARSKFRSRFRLGPQERAHLDEAEIDSVVGLIDAWLVRTGLP